MVDERNFTLRKRNGACFGTQLEKISGKQHMFTLLINAM
jgi:hypothetical protein